MLVLRVGKSGKRTVGLNMCDRTHVLHVSSPLRQQARSAWERSTGPRPLGAGLWGPSGLPWKQGGLGWAAPIFHVVYGMTSAYLSCDCLLCACVCLFTFMFAYLCLCFLMCVSLCLLFLRYLLWCCMFVLVVLVFDLLALNVWINQ